ncbi:MAG: tetratricopeptide repeat protein [Fuerstiella sp.]|nr:tetratricopeptide repeat protein [Fuerstiella sp.]MCP4857565.1 tetratricopeptide repeat protein [Fuerstiella sp.]
MKTGRFTGRLLSMLVAVGFVLLIPSAAPADKATDDFNLAVNLFRKERWNLASDTFGAFLKTYPQHPRASLAQLYYGLSLNSLEDYGPARKQFEAFIADNPSSRNIADAKYRLADCSFYLKEYPTAIAQLTDYLSRHSGHNLNNWASLMLGNSYNAVRDWSKAELTLRALVAVPPEAQLIPDATFALARSLEGLEKKDESLQLYAQVAAQKVAVLSARALARMGTMHFEDGEYEKASESYNRIVTEYKGQPIANSAALQSGVASFRLGKHEAALASLKNVAAESKLLPQAAMLKGLCLRELGQLDNARKTLSDAYAAAGDTPLAAEILFKRAQVEQLDDRKQLAAQMFRDLADRWPQDSHVVDSLFNAAELLMELEDLQTSRSLLNRISADFPDQLKTPRVQILVGRILLNDQKPKDAMTVLRAVMASPDVTSMDASLARYHLIRSLHQDEQFEMVLTEIKPLREKLRDPMYADLIGALALAAMSSLELKQYPDVQEFADELLQLQPDNTQAADVLAARAVAFSHLQDVSAASADLDRLVKEFPENPQTWMAVLQSAEAAWQHEDYVTSATLFEVAAKHEPDRKVHAAAVSGAAWSRYRLKEFAKSQLLFSLFSETYPKSDSAAESAYMAALSLCEAGDGKSAAPLFAALHKQLAEKAASDPGGINAPWLLDSGQMFARLIGQDGQVDAADKAWDALAKTFAKYDRLDVILDEWAYLNLQHERYERADGIYRQLLAEFPNSPYAGQARLSLAESNMLANELESALREFTVIATDKRYPESAREPAMYHVIDISAAQRMWPNVLKFAKLFAVEFGASPHASKVQLFHGEAFLDQGNLTEAEQVLQELRKETLEGQHSASDWTDRIWVLLAEVALTRKQYADIDSMADELVAHSPNSRFLFQMRDVQGRRWKSQAAPDFAKARDYFQQVTLDEVGRGTETAARCQFLIGETLLLENRRKEALTEYHRVYLNYQGADEWRMRGLFQAAGCELALGDKSGAVRSYQDLVTDFPESELARQAAEKLKEIGPAPK